MGQTTTGDQAKPVGASLATHDFEGDLIILWDTVNEYVNEEVSLNSGTVDLTPEQQKELGVRITKASGSKFLSLVDEFNEKSSFAPDSVTKEAYRHMAHWCAILSKGADDVFETLRTVIHVRDCSDYLEPHERLYVQGIKMKHMWRFVEAHDTYMAKYWLGPFEPRSLARVVLDVALTAILLA